MSPLLGIRIQQAIHGTVKVTLKHPPHRKKRRTIRKWLKDSKREKVTQYFVLKLGNEFFVHPEVYERLKSDIPVNPDILKYDPDFRRLGRW